MKCIQVSKFLFWYFLIITLVFVILSLGFLWPLFSIPIYVYVYLKRLKYYYDDENLYIEKGAIFHNKEVIPLKNIDSVEHKNLLGIKYINIRVKSVLKSLAFIKDEKKESIDLMEKITNSKKNRNSESSTADEILKFKNLLDQGIITQEEFDKKKKELLK